MTDTVYTDAVVADLTERYEAVAEEDYTTRSAVVAEIADELGVKEASVRSKLVSLRIYRPKEKGESNGTAGTRKEAYVAAIEAVAGTEMPSLVKATKADLKALFDFIKQTSIAQDAAVGRIEPTA